MKTNQQQLFDDIEKEVLRLEPNMKRNDPAWMGMCLILALATMERPDGVTPESFLEGVSGYDRDTIGQLIVNLEAGGVLHHGELYRSAAKMLTGEMSGIALGLLANVAVGHMNYSDKHRTFALTRAGTRYVEKGLPVRKMRKTGRSK